VRSARAAEHAARIASASATACTAATRRRGDDRGDPPSTRSSAVSSRASATFCCGVSSGEQPSRTAPRAAPPPGWSCHLGQRFAQLFTSTVMPAAYANRAEQVGGAHGHVPETAGGAPPRAAREQPTSPMSTDRPSPNAVTRRQQRRGPLRRERQADVGGAGHSPPIRRSRAIWPPTSPRPSCFIIGANR